MATEKDSVKVVGVEKPEKGKTLSANKRDGDESESGFWFRIKLIFSCITSRSKVDSSLNATTTVVGKSLSSSTTR